MKTEQAIETMQTTVDKAIVMSDHGLGAVVLCRF